MTKADELAAKLKQTRHTSADQAIDSWPGQVYELYHQIEGWLQPLMEGGLTLRRNATHVHESRPDGETCDYGIDQLMITGNRHSMTFDPIARFTEDGEGRIKVHCQCNELALLRTVEDGQTHWWLQGIEQNTQQDDGVALTEDCLLSVVKQGLELP